MDKIMPKNDHAEIVDKVVGILKFDWLPEDVKRWIRRIIGGAITGANVFMLGACGENPEPIRIESVAHAMTEEPTISPTAKPTETPAPPISTPAATSDAEYMEEKEKLWILGEEKLIEFNSIHAILYKDASGNLLISFTFITTGAKNWTIDDIFSEENAFLFENGKYNEILWDKNAESVNSNNGLLSGTEFLCLSTPYEMGYEFEPYGIEIDPDMNRQMVNYANTQCTKSQVAEIYLKFVPKKNRTYGSNFAKENKAKPSDTTPSPKLTSQTVPKDPNLFGYRTPGYYGEKVTRVLKINKNTQYSRSRGI